MLPSLSSSASPLPSPAAVQAQGLDPALLTKPPTDAWPTYHGDYSGRRFSTLKPDQHDRTSRT